MYRDSAKSGDSGKSGKWNVLKISWESQGIRPMLETVRGISGKMQIFVSSISLFPNTQEKTRNTTNYDPYEIVGFHFPLWK